MMPTQDPYQRVIPRDLFNESNLLKCYGQLYLKTEGVDGVELEHDGRPFNVEQDPSSGAISISNVTLLVRGSRCRLHRPLNSREPWPLYLTLESDEELPVFNDDGTFTGQMASFIYWKVDDE